MNASIDELIQRFFDLCAAHDSRLRQAIAGCKIYLYPDGWIAYLEAAPQQAPWLWHFMPTIVKLLSRLGHFQALNVQTDNRFCKLQMDDLIKTFPQFDEAPEVGNDRESTIEQQEQIDGYYRAALLDYLAQTTHAFVISLDGIYQDVRLYVGSPATVPASAMIGQPLEPFIGATGAAYLLNAMQSAYTLGQSRDLDYSTVHPDGSLRRYRGTVIPIATTRTCVVLASRVKQASPTHSLKLPL